jgi:hypothetical protein
VIEDGRPPVAAVDRLPDTTERRSEIIRLRRRWNAGDRRDAATAKRSDLAPGEIAKARRRHGTVLVSGNGPGGQSQGKRDKRSEHLSDLSDKFKRRERALEVCISS